MQQISLGFAREVQLESLRQSDRLDAAKIKHEPHESLVHGDDPARGLSRKLERTSRVEAAA